jgi:hypothetical protein
VYRRTRDSRGQSEPDIFAVKVLLILLERRATSNNMDRIVILLEKRILKDPYDVSHVGLL